MTGGARGRARRRRTRVGRTARAARGQPAETWLGARPRLRDEAERLSVVVLFPSGYPLAMSNLGFQAAFAAFVGEDGVRCERAFWERGAAPRSHETGAPLRDFDIIAISLPFELGFLSVAAALNAAGIPLLSSERSDDDPIVVAGGICAALNPEPVAGFLDAVLVGDADALVPPLVEGLVGTAAPRAERLAALAALPGVYIPRLYDVERSTTGVAFRPVPGAPLPVRPALRPDRLTESTILSGEALFENMYLIETSRGCGRGCRFCAAGHVYVPQRSRSAAELAQSVRRAAAHTRRVGLVSAALGDHPEWRAILRAMRDLDVELNVSSLRAETVDDELAGLLVSAGVRTVTMAPETGSEELREIIGKPTRDAAVVAAVRALAGAGLARLKLYFMIGLPGERSDDVAAIPTLVRELHSVFSGGRRGGRLSVGVSAFVPKPRTPFQWLPMAPERDLREKLSLLRRALSSRPVVEFSSEGPRESRMEGVLARGGRELSQAIRLAAVEGVPWKAAVTRARVDPEAVVGRDYGDHEGFPWDVIDVGVPRATLLASLNKARRLIERRA